MSTKTGETLTRTVYVYAGDQLVAEQITQSALDAAPQPQTDRPVRGTGKVWTVDPVNGQVVGQFELTPRRLQQDFAHRTSTYNEKIFAEGRSTNSDCDEIKARFIFVMPGLTSSPQELVDPHDGAVLAYAAETLYGKRTWHGNTSFPLLYVGQYLDSESGWAYNRYRYYHPHAGIYNAQDPLGVAPCFASAQAYVDHPAVWIHPLGLKRGPCFPFTPRDIQTWVGPIHVAPYKDVKGHHVPLKSAINTTTNARMYQRYAPAVSESELAKFGALEGRLKGREGWEIHQEITTAQRKVFDNARQQGNDTLTWSRIRDLDVRAHVEAGIPKKDAKKLVNLGMKYDRANGIDAPTKLPWSSILPPKR